MSAEKHTPPFTVEHNRRYLAVIDANGKTVISDDRYAYSSGAASVEEVMDGKGFDGEERERVIAANQAQVELFNLFAAAPAMREALRKAENVINQLVLFVDDEGRMEGDVNGDDDWFSTNGQLALDAIRTALASAEGEG